MKLTRLALLFALLACSGRAFALPNLKMTALSAQCSGENELLVNGTVANVGDAPAATFKLTIYLTYYSLDYFTLTTLNVPLLAAGANIPFSKTLTIDPFYPDGQSYISVTVDLANNIAESNEDDNTTDSNDIYLPCSTIDYDLQAVEVFFLDNGDGTGDPVQNFTLGAQYWANIRYQVVGGGSFSVPIDIQLDGAPLCNGTIDSVPGNTLKRSACLDPWIATNGFHTLTGRLDPFNTTAEPNEANNTVTLQFGVGVDTPSPTPTPTASSTPTPTASPSPTPSPSASPTPTPPPSPSPTATPVSPASLLDFLLGRAASTIGLDLNVDGSVDAADLLRSEL